MAADYTIYYDSTKVSAPLVIAGNPPVDQSAQVATLTAKVAKMQTALDIAKSDAQQRKDLDATKVDGQAVLDAIAAV